MRNCAYASMDDYNDVSTHNQYNRALADGFSPEEARVWFSWKAGTMRGHRFNGMIQKMPDLQQENPG